METRVMRVSFLLWKNAVWIIKNVSGKGKNANRHGMFMRLSHSAI